MILIIVTSPIKQYKLRTAGQQSNREEKDTSQYKLLN